MSFRRDIEEENATVVTDIGEDRSVLQVAFGGLAQGMGMPPFEFYNLTSSFPTSKVYVRDLGQSWYHGTLPGVGRGIRDLRDYLQGLLDEHQPNRTVFFGNSMGGYAAMLFGHLLGIDAVVAFSPQTFIDWKNRWYHGDHRWWREVIPARWRTSAEPLYFDLRYVLEPEANSQFDLHVPKLDKLDRLHAERMGHISGVQVVVHDEIDHGLVRYLRNQEELRSILLEVLDVG